MCIVTCFVQRTWAISKKKVLKRWTEIQFMKADEGVVTKTELLKVVVMETLTQMDEEMHKNVLRRNDKYIEELLKE